MTFVDPVDIAILLNLDEKFVYRENLAHDVGLIWNLNSKVLATIRSISKNTIEGFAQYSIPLLAREKRIPKEFDPAPVVDNRFVAAAMKADPAAFADLPAIQADKRLP